MKTNAKTLRNLVTDNALTMGRLDAKTIGMTDYKELTKLYNNALDALTEWASKDYAHKSTVADSDNSFTAVKAILELYATEEDRIIIDQSSMRTMRDCATKPRRMYSEEYKKAHKAYKHAEKVVAERYEDLLAMGAPARNEEESAEDYVARIRELGIKTMSGSVDMVDMFINANGVYLVREKARQDVIDKGNYSWKRPVAVSTSEFAELVENYIADCLVDNYNIKPSKVVRDEKAAALAERKAAKEAEKAAIEKTA